MPQEPAHAYRTKLTLFGTVLAVTALLFILSFLFFDFIIGGASPYLGMFTFLILPGFFVLGLVLTLIGVARTRRQLRAAGDAVSIRAYYPQIDLRNPRHRRVLAFVAVGVALFLPFIGVMSYEGYHYTDSNEFCGELCHQVMEPQYATYLQSPHSRVKCVECHIGAGATWYVKSKMSGVRQVFATMLDTYPRPIPPAITELRPARETCEQCHWPAKFFGDQLVTFPHFASDEENTARPVQMLVKTGGGDATVAPPSGIHWHMVLGYTVEFVATDHTLQDIVWVRRTNHETGNSTVYRSDGLAATDAPPHGEMRKLDCMDCHNMPTHVYRSPDQAADFTLNVNPSFQSLPYAKREVVQAVVQPYESKEAGLAGVRDAVLAAYRDKRPEIWTERQKDVEHLADEAASIFDLYFYPHMNVRWDTYPNNIGHMYFPGCFRCHDGEHVSGDGVPITTSCQACHDFLNTDTAADGSPMVRSGAFNHSFELVGPHAEINCSQCHSGGPTPPNTCRECHAQEASFFEGELAGWDKPLPEDPMAGLGCADCHDLEMEQSEDNMADACAACHDDDYGEMYRGWKTRIADLMAHPPAGTPISGRPALLEALKEAGPLHNIHATWQLLGVDESDDENDDTTED